MNFFSLSRYVEIQARNSSKHKQASFILDCSTQLRINMKANGDRMRMQIWLAIPAKRKKSTGLKILDRFHVMSILISRSALEPHSTPFGKFAVSNEQKV